MKRHVLIIAEAGVNHNGSIELAKKLVDAAAEAGVDVIKFQTFKAENIVTRNAEKANYQLGTTDKKENQYEMIKHLELSENDHYSLFDYCKKKGIQFCSSPFDVTSIDFLKEIGMPFWKIPSGEITNLPYLRKIGSFNEKIVMSTGMSSLGEIESALNILQKAGTVRDKITVLQCNTEYPTPYADVNLSAMNTIKEALKVKVGYSDHTLGIEIPIAAVALGAEVIEKHFTLDNNMKGPDHKASLEPDELEAMVSAIRNVEKAFGNGIKTPSHSELKNRSVVRKSIVAKRKIAKGEVFTEENLTVKRPGTKMSPMRWDEIIGKVAEKNYIQDELI